MRDFEFQTRIAKEQGVILARQIKAGQLRFHIKRSHAEERGPVERLGNLRREEQYVERLFNLTNEIVEAFRSLEAVERYLNEFQFPFEQVSASDYIHYHLTTYYHEAYILYQRMLAFSKRIAREFREAPSAARIESKVAYVVEEVKRLFQPIGKLRSGHVHESRYDDEEFQRLRLLELITPGREDAFEGFLQEARTGALESNGMFVREMNRGLGDKVERFFSYFEGLVFQKDGRIRYPPNIGSA